MRCWSQLLLGETVSEQQPASRYERTRKLGDQLSPLHIANEMNKDVKHANQIERTCEFGIQGGSHHVRSPRFIFPGRLDGDGGHINSGIGVTFFTEHARYAAIATADIQHRSIWLENVRCASYPVLHPFFGGDVLFAGLAQIANRPWVVLQALVPLDPVVVLIEICARKIIFSHDGIVSKLALNSNRSVCIFYKKSYSAIFGLSVSLGKIHTD